MNKIHYIVTMAVLLVSTALFTSFVFVPTVAPFEIVNIEISSIPEQELESEEPEYVPTLEDLWVMEEGITKIMSAEILNRELPSNWNGKEIYFKYTYIGEFTENSQSILDNLLLDEYKWQKQLDEQGNVVMGGIVLGKDGTFQLHTHNTFTRGERFFLLGDLLDRYHSREELVGTRIRFGSVTLESVWERDTRLLQDSIVPYADLVISTTYQSPVTISF